MLRFPLGTLECVVDSAKGRLLALPRPTRKTFSLSTRVGTSPKQERVSTGARHDRTRGVHPHRGSHGPGTDLEKGPGVGRRGSELSHEPPTDSRRVGQGGRHPFRHRGPFDPLKTSGDPHDPTSLPDDHSCPETVHLVTGHRCESHPDTYDDPVESRDAGQGQVGTGRDK